VKIFLYYIKGLFTIFNGLIFLLLLAWVAKRFQKKRLSRSLLIAAAVLFLLCSTSYLPQFLANKLESQYSIFNPATLKNHKGKIYIHLLGSGYGSDYRLPATAQLGTTAQVRLIEAIRLYRQLDSSVLVCSGSSVAEPEPQSQVAKKAAIMLGVDSSRIITLDTPSTTQEEVAALAKTVGTNAFVIIVTDAIHMPRAVKLFSRQGFNTAAAPANFKVMKTQHDLSVKWWPSGGNITLMDIVMHEYLGNLKASFSSL
jgi:uncharacterized SAM-binding protein YcdF (DUF218 family)